jgi:hypothetical protein
MRRLAFPFASALVAGSLAVALAAAPGAPATAPTALPAAQEPAVTGYICPMHPDVILGEPGKCPRCGMDLVPGNPLGTANYRLRARLW